MEQCISIIYHKCGFTERQGCVLNIFDEMLKAFTLSVLVRKPSAVARLYGTGVLGDVYLVMDLPF